jgi:uncharacterized membrane protein YhdT
MPPQIRAIIAVLSGVVLGYSIIYIFQVYGPYRPPEGIGLQNGYAYNNWVSTLSTSAYIYFLASYLIAAFLGGALSGYIVLGTRYQIASLLTGFLLLILAIGSFLAFNHPEWMSYSACIGFVVFGGLGGWVVRKIFK